MAEPNLNPEGDHIEELLSQLKGIFGHLSETEQAEARQKVTPPPAAPAPVPAPEPLHQATPEPEAPVDPPPVEFNAPAPAAPPKPVGTASSASNFTPNEVAVPAGATLVAAAIFYPVGRSVEAKA